MDAMGSGLSAAEADCTIRCEPRLTVDTAHIWRSKLVEKCVESERHVLRLLLTAGGTCQARAPLSQKIEALKKALAGPRPTACSTKLLRLLENLRPLSDLRSELVHSTVSISVIEGESVAVFRNAAEQLDGVGDRTVMTQARLKDLHEALSRLANSLGQEADKT